MLKKAVGQKFAGLFTNQLGVFYNDEFSMDFVEPIMKLKNINTNDYTYYRFSWRETEEGDDIILVDEQNTLDTHDNEQADQPSLGSHIFINGELLKAIKGYGYKDDKGSEHITVMVFELESVFLIIEARPVVLKGKISRTRPNNLEGLNEIFSYKKN